MTRNAHRTSTFRSSVILLGPQPEAGLVLCVLSGKSWAAHELQSMMSHSPVILSASLGPCQGAAVKCIQNTCELLTTCLSLRKSRECTSRRVTQYCSTGSHWLYSTCTFGMLLVVRDVENGPSCCGILKSSFQSKIGQTPRKNAPHQGRFELVRVA